MNSLFIDLLQKYHKYHFGIRNTQEAFVL